MESNALYSQTLKLQEICAPLFKVERLNPEVVQLLASVDEVTLNTFIRLLFPEFKNNPRIYTQLQDFYTVVVDGSVGISIWLENIFVVFEWLKLQKKTATFDDVLQYVSCYFESNSDDSVAVFLVTYGFERAYVRVAV